MAMAKNRAEMEKFPPVHFQRSGRGKRPHQNGKISTSALQPVGHGKNRAKTEKFPPVHFQLGGCGEKAFA